MTLNCKEKDRENQPFDDKFTEQARRKTTNYNRFGYRNVNKTQHTPTLYV